MTLPASTAIADGEIINITVVQPSGSHSYTFPTTLTAGAGTQVEFEATGGCASMPAMPTGTDNELLLGIHYICFKGEFHPDNPRVFHAV